VLLASHASPLLEAFAVPSPGAQLGGEAAAGCAGEPPIARFNTCQEVNNDNHFVSVGKSKTQSHKCSLLGFLTLLHRHSQASYTALKETQSCLRSPGWQDRGIRPSVLAFVPGLCTTPPGHAARSETLPTNSRKDFFFSMAYPNTQPNLQTGRIDLQL